MSEKLHSVWPILALDGVGDTIGDARPAFVVTDDARFLHFANAAGARFLALSPARALQARVTLEPRLAARLARFAAGARPGDETRELMRVSDGLRSTLLSLTFRRPVDGADAILVVVDDQRPNAADADPAASLKPLAAEGGLLALFDEDGDVIASLGDHHALDGIHTDVETALDSDDDAAVFEHRLVSGGRARDFALVRLGNGPRARRLMHVGVAEAVAAVAVPAVETVAAVAEIATVAEAPTAEPAPEPLLAEVLADPAAAVVEEIADLPVAPVVETPVAETVIPETPVAEAPVTDESIADAPVAEVEAVLAAISPEAPETEPDAVTVIAETHPTVEAETVPAALVDAAPEVEPVLPEPIAIEPAVVAPTVEMTAEVAAEADAEDEENEDEADAEVDAPAPSGFRHTPIGRAVKFVWQMDADRRFTLISDEFAAVVGPRAADLIGRTWRDVASELGLDGEGRVAEALDRRDTWSGRTVLWPIEGEALRLPVDLAALPAFDRGRVFAGFRGFGTIRGEEAVPDPAATGLRLARAAALDTATAVAAPEPAAAEATPAAAIDAVPAVDENSAPQLWPDDAEIALVEAAHPQPVEPTIDGGEAAFAGEIDLPAVAAASEPETPVVAEPIAAPAAPIAAEATTTPVDWPDDEVALAMASLPPYDDGDGSFAGEIDETAPNATPVTAIESAAVPLATVIADAGAPPVAAEPTSPAETPEEAADDEPHAAGDAASIVLPPVSPLALHAAGITLDDDDDETPDDRDDDVTHAPITATQRDVAAAVEALAATHGSATPMPSAPSPAVLAATLAAAPIAAALLRRPEPADATAPSTDATDAIATTPEAIDAAVAEPVDATVAEASAAVTEPQDAVEPEATADAAPQGDSPEDTGPRIILPTRSSTTTLEAAAHAVLHPERPSDTPPTVATSDAAGQPAEPVATAADLASDVAADLADLVADAAPEADPLSPVAETPVVEAPVVDAPAPTTPEVPPAAVATPAPPPADPTGNVVTLAGTPRRGAEAVRLSPPERVAFRQIAEALGARIEGDDAPTRGPTDSAPRALLSREPAKPAETAPSPNGAGSETRLLDRLPTPVAVVKDETLAYANDAFLRLLGYKDVAALQNEGGLDALFAGEHVARRWEASADGSRPVPVLARDGRVIPVDAVVSTVPWSGASALMLTLTEAAALPAGSPAPSAPVAAPASVPVEAALRERVGELEAVIDTATDGVLMLDGEGIILSANHAAEALFGTDRREMIGRPLTDRLAPESRRSAMDYLDGLARNGVASVLNDGREVIGAVERGGLIPMFMTIGRISVAPAHKYCAVLRDITHWKKSEEDLTAARRRAEEASVHKSDFLAKISHEIRTPLNAIIGFSEVMMDERFGPVGNDRYKDYLRDIHSSGSHIMSLINDLLDLSKVEAGKMDLRFEAVALGDIMSECVAMMQPQANRERIIIRSSLPSGVPPVVADPRSVRQVMLNLLSNAIKFTPSGGQVIVSTTLEDSGEVVMRVRDTGYGMTDKELQTAMEPFRQLHTTRSRGGGTGLGLPLTKALVEANRAVFRIDSTVGQGTLATVTFPVTRVLAS